MSVYKVPQDVEAEDKLLGPFTFKQFIFLIIFTISGFIGFTLAKVSIVTVIPILPIFLASGLLAFYHPKDQPAETKIAAYMQFFLKPKKRVWSRDGIHEHVKITAPKKIERNYTDTRSKQEIRSQLKQLSQVMDTRGWSLKRSEIQQPTSYQGIQYDDRLVAPTTNTYQEPIDIHESDDMLDEAYNPTAQKFDELSQTTHDQARAAAIAKMKAATKAPPVQAQPNQPPKPNLIQPQTKPKPTAPAKDDSLLYEPFPSMNQKVVKPIHPNIAKEPQVQVPPEEPAPQQQAQPKDPGATKIPSAHKAQKQEAHSSKQDNKHNAPAASMNNSSINITHDKTATTKPPAKEQTKTKPSDNSLSIEHNTTQEPEADKDKEQANKDNTELDIRH